MRFFLCSLLIFFISINVSLAQLVDQIRITVNYIDQPLQNILIDLQTNYPVKFFCKNEWLPDRTLSIQLQNETVPSVLEKILQGTDLKFVFYGPLIIIAPDQLIGKEFDQQYFITKKKQEDLLKTQKWSTASEIIIVGDSLEETTNISFLLEGQIIDRLNSDPLQGVNLYFEAIDQSTFTDKNGNFKIRVPPGYNLLELSYVGYEKRKILLHVHHSGHIEINLTPDAHELEEVLITGDAMDENTQSVFVGITRLKPRQIKELPVFLGEADVIKSILTLPGVSNLGEGAGGFNVRGGSIDQNLILQDEALIYNSSHALGFFSVFNPDAIREITFYKGHIPAQYGGRLSSVLNVKLKGEDNAKFRANGGIGFVVSRLVLEGPLRSSKKEIEKPARTSFLVGGRITYSDWMLRIIKDPQVYNSSASFYDLNLKLSHRYNDKGSVTASYYQSYDFVQFSDQYGFHWKNRAASFRWNHLISPDISSNFSASYSSNSNTSFEPSGIDAFNLDNGISNLRLKEDFLFSGFKSHNLTSGVEYIKYFMMPDKLQKREEKSAIIPEKVNKDNAQELGVYINDEYIINHLISVSAGFRYNLFQQVGPGDTYLYEGTGSLKPDNIIDTISYPSGKIIKSFQTFEPRLSFKYSLNPISSVKFAYNRMNQFIHLLSNSTAAIPVDFWQVSGPYISPQKADSYSLGYYRNFSDNMWETSLEFYFRNISNLIEFKDFPDLLLNNHIETEILAGRGKSYGGELYIRKRRGKINGSLSYDYSRTFSKVDGANPEEKIHNGQWFRSKLDRPHNLNIVFNIYINKSNTFSANFTYLSGRPITAPVSNYYQGDILIPHYSGRNDYRIPDYHRLDISYTIKRNIIKRRRYKDSFTFSIYNLYGRKNAYSIFFRKNPGSTVNAYKLSIIGTVFPSITYNFEF